jgi:cellulose synthase/poly-beta-1,6-N-acetylglucosamine synthase-like glycosyltransferase
VSPAVTIANFSGLKIFSSSMAQVQYVGPVKGRIISACNQALIAHAQLQKFHEAVRPAVTVFSPVYGKNTIERALDSVFAQTFTDFEIIVLDYDCTDLTFEVLTGFH